MIDLSLVMLWLAPSVVAVRFFVSISLQELVRHAACSVYLAMCRTAKPSSNVFAYRMACSGGLFMSLGLCLTHCGWPVCEIKHLIEGDRNHSVSCGIEQSY